MDAVSLRADSQHGFTLIELIMVMLLVGILAFAALPRFAGIQVFKTRGFFDQTLAMLRYAQKAAIAQRRDVYVNIDAAAGKICVTYAADAACAGSTLNDPAGQARFVHSAPDGTVFAASTSFSFTALGRPNPNGAHLIGVVADGATSTITVERETGYVH